MQNKSPLRIQMTIKICSIDSFLQRDSITMHNDSQFGICHSLSDTLVSKTGQHISGSKMNIQIIVIGYSINHLYYISIYLQYNFLCKFTDPIMVTKCQKEDQIKLMIVQHTQSGPLRKWIPTNFLLRKCSVIYAFASFSKAFDHFK